MAVIHLAHRATPFTSYHYNSEVHPTNDKSFLTSTIDHSRIHDDSKETLMAVAYNIEHSIVVTKVVSIYNVASLSLAGIFSGGGVARTQVPHEEGGAG